MMKNKIISALTIKGDKGIWAMAFFLIISSFFILYSASGYEAFTKHGGNTGFAILTRLGFLVISGIVFFVCYAINYKFFVATSVLILFAGVLLVILAMMFGPEINHAKRWLSIPGLPFTFQPSEIAKIGLILYISRILAKYQRPEGCDINALKPILIAIGITCGFIILQDFSTAALLGLSSFALMIIGRVHIKYLAIIAVSVITLMLLLVLFCPGARFDEARTRLGIGKNLEQVAKDTRQVDNAKIAVATGGVFGNGPGNSVQRNFLPLPYSDYVYAIIIEEYGMIGGFTILLMYLIILTRGFHIVRKSSSALPAFVAMGMVLLIVIQAFSNMGVAVDLLPVTGQTLPLISKGGTSLVMTSAIFGLLLNISKHVEKPEEEFIQAQEQEKSEEEGEKKEIEKEKIEHKESELVM